MKVAAGADAPSAPYGSAGGEHRVTWFQSFLTRIEQRYPRGQLEIAVDCRPLVANWHGIRRRAARSCGDVDVADTMSAAWKLRLAMAGPSHFDSHDQALRRPRS